MTLFIQNDATGAGSGSLAADQAFVDLAVCVNGDTGLALATAVGNRQQVNYARTLPGPPPTRIDNVVNTAFTPDYGSGPQAVNIIVLAVQGNFFFNNGDSVLNVGGRAIAPRNSGLPSASLNNTNECLVVYDTTQSNGRGYCTARAGTGGTLDLRTPNPVILYHELSHAFRIVNNNLRALTAGCNPSSPEENAAITDENDLRTQIAAAMSTTAVLRDPGIHCGDFCAGGPGSCCVIIATAASGSMLSAEVAALRAIRDGVLRKSEVGFSFFESLHYDYYGFSPQVCTLMARHSELKPLVLEGLVRPLITILLVIERFIATGAGAVSLGQQFVGELSDRDAAVARSAVLLRARSVLAGETEGLTVEEQKLAELLYPALESAHVKWALIEPVAIYASALRAYLANCDAEQIGTHLSQDINAWTARMPLDDVWGNLALDELRNELESLESTLLRTPETRTTFRSQLRERFAGITAIETLLGTT